MKFILATMIAACHVGDAAHEQPGARPQESWMSLLGSVGKSLRNIFVTSEDPSPRQRSVLDPVRSVLDPEPGNNQAQLAPEAVPGAPEQNVDDQKQDPLEVEGVPEHDLDRGQRIGEPDHGPNGGLPEAKSDDNSEVSDLSVAQPGAAQARKDISDDVSLSALSNAAPAKPQLNDFELRRKQDEREEQNLLRRAKHQQGIRLNPAEPRRKPQHGQKVSLLRQGIIAAQGRAGNRRHEWKRHLTRLPEIYRKRKRDLKHFLGSLETETVHTVTEMRGFDKIAAKYQIWKFIYTRKWHELGLENGDALPREFIQEMIVEYFKSGNDLVENLEPPAWFKIDASMNKRQLGGALF